MSFAVNVNARLCIARLQHGRNIAMAPEGEKTRKVEFLLILRPTNKKTKTKIENVDPLRPRRSLSVYFAGEFHALVSTCREQHGRNIDI